MKKKAIIIILSVLAAWLTVFAVDYVRVLSEQSPIFCIKTQECHYTGLGYAFDWYPHPITGKREFAMYLFGIEIGSNFTN